MSKTDHFVTLLLGNVGLWHSSACYLGTYKPHNSQKCVKEHDKAYGFIVVADWCYPLHFPDKRPITKQKHSRTVWTQTFSNHLSIYCTSIPTSSTHPVFGYTVCITDLWASESSGVWRRQFPASQFPNCQLQETVVNLWQITFWGTHRHRLCFIIRGTLRSSWLSKWTYKCRNVLIPLESSMILWSLTTWR